MAAHTVRKPEEVPARELAELLGEVRRIGIQAQRLVTEMMAGSYHSVFRGTGIEFDEVREYIAGDDPRSVDWNVTARVGKPYIKKYVDERALSVMFLLDLSPSMNGGFGYWSAREVAARVCASLGLSAVRNNDQVGLIAFSDGVDRFVPPRRHGGHAMRIVRDCLALRGSGTTTRMSPALELAGRVLRRGSIVFVLSDFLGDGWEDAIARCAVRHDVIAVLLSPPELAPPDAGMMRIRDPESGRDAIVDWRSPVERNAYTARVAAWQTRTRAALTKARVDLMDVPIPTFKDPNVVLRPALRFFRMREERRLHR